MPAVTPLVINDRAATPVAHTFTPSGQDPVTGLWVFEELTGVPAARARFTHVKKVQANGKIRLRMGFAVPVVVTETINGVVKPTKIRDGYANVEFTFDGLSTDQERKDLVGYVFNSLNPAQTMIDKTLVNLENLY